MAENDGRKTVLTEKIFTTNCCNGQTDSSFDDTAEKFLSESQEEFRSSFNDEQKKESFRKKSLHQISLTSGNPFWQNCYLFSDRKNRLIFRSMFEKDEKTYRKISKQMFVFKVILRTLRKQCRPFGRKKIRTKTDQFAIDVRK